MASIRWPIYSASDGFNNLNTSPNWFPNKHPMLIGCYFISSRLSIHNYLFLSATSKNLIILLMSVLYTDTNWVVTPRLSFNPAVENIFWLIFISLLSLNIALIVSILVLYSLKWMYLCRVSGLIFLSLGLNFSLILLLSNVLLYIF